MDTTRDSTALVLTAGLGTRLRPLSDVRAKPAMPVAGEPMVRRIIRWLASHGVDDLVLNLHHRPETITAVVGDGRDLGAGTLLVGAAAPSRQRGRPAPRALDHRRQGRRYVLRHQRRHAHRRGPSRSGGGAPRLGRARHAGARPQSRVPPLRRRAARRRAAGDRLPRAARRRPRPYHYIGVQVAQAAAFASLPGTNRPVNRRLCDALMRTRPGGVGGFVCNAAFWDVGTVADYWRTSLAFVARAGGAGQHAAGSARGSTRPRASRTRFCGTMWRWAPAPYSTNASSPTACACRPALGTRARLFVRGHDGTVRPLHDRDRSRHARGQPTFASASISICATAASRIGTRASCR